MRIHSIIQAFIDKLPILLFEIPRKVQKIYNSFIMNLDQLCRALGTSVENLISEEKLTSTFLMVQTTKLMNFLNRCNKSAVVAYEPRIREYEYQLRYQDFTKISVSNYVLLESRIGIKLSGWFPKFILFRIKFLEQSGIVDWWKGFVTSMLNATSKDKKGLTSSNNNGMAGNLFVIFVVYATGCCAVLHLVSGDQFSPKSIKYGLKYFNLSLY